MKSDFLVALTQLAAERGLSHEIVLSAVEDALVSACKKDGVAAGHDITVKLDPASGDLTVNILKTVVEEVEDENVEIAVADAQAIVPSAALGEVIVTESMPHNAGRIAAQMAKQVVIQRLRDAEREKVYKQYEGREGEILYVTLTRADGRNILVDLGAGPSGGSAAVMPYSEQVPTESYRPNEKLRVLLKSVERTEARGPQLIVSRADDMLLRRLFEAEVPEIYNGAVEIEAIAREAGSRSKVAVRARQTGVDPVGSCVGLRGVRIQNIVNELRNEKIDVVEWHKEARVFIGKALSPAQALTVELNPDDQSAVAVVPEQHLSLAIGREGQNVRLAARLTGWRLDIRSDVEYEVELKERARLAAEARAVEAQLAAEAALAAPRPIAPDADAAPDDAHAPELVPAAADAAPDEIAAQAAPAATLEPTDAASDAPQPAAAADAPEEPVALESGPAAATEDLPAAAATPLDADEPETASEQPAAEIADGETPEPADADGAADEPEPAAARADAPATPQDEPIAADAAPEPEMDAPIPISDSADAVADIGVETDIQPDAPPMVMPAAQADAPADDAAQPSTSLRDLPEDIWSVRRARARRASAEDDAPGRIRFAEDIAGLRGGVTAARRRRGDRQQAPSDSRPAPKKRKSGRRRR